jgi:20S proteasome subunit beta 3
MRACDSLSNTCTDGGAAVAMVGKDCVAIACDLRLGMQALTISNNFPKIFQYGDVFLGLTGLATDVATVSDLFRYKVNMYRLREERNISPQTMANLVSSSLYEKRFGPYFVSPVIAGINQTTGKPFICGFDSIGCIDFAKDFIVSGTASDQLFGTCEGLWEPDLVCHACAEWSSACDRELTRMPGPRGPVRDHLASVTERCRPGRAVGMGSTRVHHREGQGYQAVIEGQAGLKWLAAYGDSIWCTKLWRTKAGRTSWAQILKRDHDQGAT